MGVEHVQLDRAQLVPGELVGASAMPGQRLFFEGVDRDPPEVVAAGAGEVGEVLGRVGGELDVGAGELVNTGSSVLLNVLAGLFILGATAVVTVISRRGRQALPQSDTSWVLTK